ncbi:hypothetical protein [Rhizocola hellebori]|nr:hypothetical protein [Rhizocola hellebori]
MSATALRWSAVPLGMLAFALRLAATLWWEPFTWRFNWFVSLLLWLAAMIVTVGVPFGIFALLSRGYRRPAEFALGKRGFTAPLSPIGAGSQAILLLFLAGGLVVTERVPNSDSMRLAEFNNGWFASLIIASVLAAGAVTIVLTRRQQLLLDAEGLTIRRWWRGRRLKWDELAPGGPLPPAKKSQGSLQLNRKQPPHSTHYVPAEMIGIAFVDIDPTYLAAAIRRYVENPQDRAAIGTAEELSRLAVAQ